MTLKTTSSHDPTLLTACFVLTERPLVAETTHCMELRLACRIIKDVLTVSSFIKQIKTVRETWIGRRMNTFQAVLIPAALMSMLLFSAAPINHVLPSFCFRLYLLSFCSSPSLWDVTPSVTAINELEHRWVMKTMSDWLVIISYRRFEPEPLQGITADVFFFFFFFMTPSRHKWHWSHPLIKQLTTLGAIQADHDYTLCTVM